jgi:glyoxylate reductase
MSTEYSIAILNPNLPEAFVGLLSSVAKVVVLQPQSLAGKEREYEGIKVVVSTAVDPVDRQLIEQLPASVGLIANVGVGVDNIDLVAAREKGIQVSNTPVVTEDTADLAFALLLATCRRIPHNERLLRKGAWAQAVGELGYRVHGKTLGIIGFGDIGQAVARRAKGFSMPVVYWGPNRKPEAEAALGASWCESLEALLAEADIVSLHCPLNEHTTHLLHQATFAAMKEGSILINTGRGALVKESDLVDALTNGNLAAAGLDVFEFEPNVEPALLTMDNVVLTPHIGSATTACRQDMALSVLENIRHFLTTGQLINPV